MTHKQGHHSGEVGMGWEGPEYPGPGPGEGPLTTVAAWLDRLIDQGALVW